MRTGRWITGVLLGVGFLALTVTHASAQKQPDTTKKSSETTQPEPKQPGKQPATAPAPRDLIKLVQDDLKKTQNDVRDLKDGGATAAKKFQDDLATTQARAADLAKEVEALKAAKPPEGVSRDDLMSAADEAKTAATDAGKSAAADATVVGKERGDTAWILTSSALVLFMVPGLALFYAGMVRRKNVLATMMQSMAALAVVGVYWVVVGYSLAFGPSVVKLDLLGVEKGGLFGWSWDLFFLKGVKADDKLPGYDISVYLHVMFQGMFAIITPALISGAIAERIRFWPFCLFMLLWVTFVYCPLAHMVWAFDWFDTSVVAAKRGASAIGLLGKMGALDFAGGTVVHIAAGMAGLACCLVLRKRHGYPEHIAHPNSMVLTLLGAGLLWFGWFGFNGGSALNSTTLAVSAFAATQAAAAAAGLGWMLVEWLHKGKPTALGLASGIVAGLVAVTPASGFVYVWGGVFIGLAATVVCYIMVNLKSVFGYDDSLDAFGVHGVGGFVGAVLTGVFASTMVNGVGADGPIAYKYHRARGEQMDGLIQKATKEKKEANGEYLKLKREVDAAVEKLGISKLDEELKKAGVAGLRKELADLKVEDLEDELTAYKGTSDGKTAAEKALAEAKAKAAAIEKKLEAVAETEKKLKEAKEAEAAEVKKLDDAKAALDDKAAALASLTKEQDALKAKFEKQDKDNKTGMTQVYIQLKAAVFSVVFALVVSLVLAVAVQAVTLGNFTTTDKEESEGLDRTEHGEVGFDFSGATESVSVVSVVSATPRAATSPPGNGRFDLEVQGGEADELMKVWTELCQPSEEPADADFLAIYPYVTTVKGKRFRFRAGDPEVLARRLESLFSKLLGGKIRAAKVG